MIRIADEWGTMRDTESTRRSFRVVVEDFDGWDVDPVGAVMPCTGATCVARAEDGM